MKFRVTMKDPDTLSDAIVAGVEREVGWGGGLTDEERDSVREMRQGTVYRQCLTWFEYGEYLTVEIDTVAGTCIVVPRK